MSETLTTVDVGELIGSDTWGGSIAKNIIQLLCMTVLLAGTWTGATADVMHGTYDTSFPIFTPLEERLKVIDFSHAVLIFPATFTTR